MSVKDNYLKFFKQETQEKETPTKKKENGEAFEISPALGVRGDHSLSFMPEHALDKNVIENEYFK